MSKKKKDKKSKNKPLDIKPHEVFPNDYDTSVAPHKTVIEAINDTQRAVAQSQQATKDRRNWIYLETEQDPEWVKTFFNKSHETVARVGENHRGKRMVAVWNGVGNEPNSDPDF